MSPEQSLGSAITAASDIYSLGCLLTELLTGDPPFPDSRNVSLRGQHVHGAVPSTAARRPAIPADVDALVVEMLNKRARLRPNAEETYDRLLPFVTGSSGAPAGAADDGRDPARPLRRPLLSPRRARPDPEPADGPEGVQPMTEQRFEAVRDEAARLLENERPSEAIRVLDGAVDSSGGDNYLRLRLRHFLALALFSADEYRRAASLFDAVGRDIGDIRTLPLPRPSIARSMPVCRTPRSGTPTTPWGTSGTISPTPIPRMPSVSSTPG